jgi:hypothetical protein
MAGLSNIFGGDNQSSSADGALSTDSVADIGNTIGLDFNSEQNQASTDDDGSSETSSNSNSLSLDSGTDSLLSNVTDAVGMTDESSN